MFTAICPKLPMRRKDATEQFYTTVLGFAVLGSHQYPDYLMVASHNIEIHFFKFEALNPAENYGQVYIRVQNITKLYQKFLANKVPIHPNGALSVKPWGMQEFAVLDPDNNLLTFGEPI
ncbi:MAG TPA: VOC family protein [Phnomibacter sp.]|nr:VOC family protein [Phnomibacter sp.]